MSASSSCCLLVVALQALEYGAIPVIEDFETFKGCDQPTQYLKDWGVPVLMVKVSQRGGGGDIRLHMLSWYAGEAE